LEPEERGDLATRAQGHRESTRKGVKDDGKDNIPQ